MVDTKKSAENVYMIDDDLYSVPGTGSVFFLTEEKKALVDTGPASSAGVVLEGIRQIGFQPEDVDYLIITHIHLDHGGGAGTLLKEMPRAKVTAHYKGIKHLLDPSKLMSSAYQALGTIPFDRNGEVLAIAEERLMPVYDGDTLKLGDEQTLTFLETPGHAPHELCIYESRNRGIFVGDGVGHFIEGTDIMVPITPPPKFDQELYIQSLYRMMKLNAARIYFAHSGSSDQVMKRLEDAVRKLREREAIIKKADAEHRLDEAAERIIKHICAELEFLKKDRSPIYDYWANVDIPMSAHEHVRYYRNKNGLN
jgi:glyoxylase-like metal-dependent hydrolase (beta-lactamase superfamily II)